MTNTELIKQAIERNTELINSISGDVYSEFQCGQMHSYGSLLAFINKLPKEEQKPVVYVPKFRVGDKVLSTNNPRLTYDILEVGLINELGKPDYRVEIFVDGEPRIPELKKEHNIHLIDCQKMDSWAELIEQKPAEWSGEDERIRGHIIDVLTYYAENHSALTVAFIKRDINWLKSLPMGCPKKTE